MIKQEIKLDEKFLIKLEDYLNRTGNEFFHVETFHLKDNKILRVVFYDEIDSFENYVRVRIYLHTHIKIDFRDIRIGSKAELFGVHRINIANKHFEEVILLKFSLNEKLESCLLKYYFKFNKLTNMMNLIEFNSFHNKNELVEALAIIVHLYPLLNQANGSTIDEKKKFITAKLEYFGYDEEYLNKLKTSAGINYLESLILWALESVYNNSTQVAVANDILLIDTYNAICFLKKS